MANRKKDDQYYINAENSKEIIMFFGNGKDKLRSFCVLCNNEESFTTDSKLTFERNGILNNKYLYKINYGGYDLFYKYLPGKEIYLNDFEIKKAYLKLVTITLIMMQTIIMLFTTNYHILKTNLLLLK